jgi:hypothetical protein
VREDGSALRNDGVELKPANSNPWYVLATVYGEQDSDKISVRTGVRPLGWTRSRGGFDRAAGVVILERGGAEIPQG